jgi:hypothetical protein
MGYDVVLALTNVSGAFLDGFFQAWETGVAVPIGAGTEALRVVADDFRSYYLSTYTSWAGMVGVAASLANARSSVSVGMAYIVVSILMAFVAQGKKNISIYIRLAALCDNSHGRSLPIHSFVRSLARARPGKRCR